MIRHKDLYTNNGDPRQDAEYRAGWNACADHANAQLADADKTITKLHAKLHAELEDMRESLCSQRYTADAYRKTCRRLEDELADANKTITKLHAELQEQHKITERLGQALGKEAK